MQFITNELYKSRLQPLKRQFSEMLQPLSRYWLLWLQPKRFPYVNVISTLLTKQINRNSTLAQRNVLLVLIFILLTLATTFTQAAVSDDLYIQPTPVLNLNKGDLTTVLLLNNDKNIGRNDYVGHHLNIRPEVGLLTSTARTFIQEGVTTEYATKVLGTTLDNGSLYAQYLRKSSRVIYDNAQQQQQQMTHQAGSTLLPTVVTSWIGDNFRSHTEALLESHNDLFNADQQDWQDIDDRLLHDGGIIFVSNTDFVALAENVKDNKKQQQQNNNKFKIVEKSNIGKKYVSQINSFVPLNLVGCEGHHVYAQIVTTNTVLPIGDLATYTVRNQSSPSDFPTNVIIVEDRSVHSYNNMATNLNRSPKLYYHQIMGDMGAINSSSNGNNSSNGVDSDDTFKKTLSAPFFNRQFSTTTYYGFTDFTTIVGDSVIVFSPSTFTKSQYFGHVTSIKGEATLGAAAIKEPSRCATIEAVHASTEETIMPPREIVNIREINTAGFNDISDLKEYSIYGVKQNTISVDGSTEQSINTINKVRVAEVPEQKEVGNINSRSISMTIVEGIDEGGRKIESNLAAATAKFSRPSNEEVLKIYASLSRAAAAAATHEAITPTVLIGPLAASTVDNRLLMSTDVAIEQLVGENIAEIKDKSVQNLEGTEVVIAAMSNTSISEQILGGAKTIFFENDPFATFDEPTTLVTMINEIMDKTSIAVSKMLNTKIKIKSLHETTTVTSSFQITTIEDEVDEDITTLEPESILKGFEEDNDSMSSIEQDEDFQQVVIQNSVTLNIFEINEDGGADANNIIRLGDCIRTSQVFLTKIAQNLTQLNTLYDPVPQGKSKVIKTTKFETELVPIFDILETTKHYCIKPHATSLIIATSSVADIKMGIAEKNAVQLDYASTSVEDGRLNGTSISTKRVGTITEVNDVDYEEVKNKYNAGDSKSKTDADDDGSAVKDNDDWYTTEDSSGEEIELIYKTLYTTYTYLTTFFNKDKISISSHTEVLTNVITSTLPSIGDEVVSIDVVAETIHKMGHESEVNEAGGTSKFVLPTELDGIFRIGEQEINNGETADPVQAYTVTSPLDDNKFIKTYLTTYTYYTTIFVEGVMEIMSRTELYTNYITGAIEPSTVFETDTQTSVANDDATMNVTLPVWTNALAAIVMENINAAALSNQHTAGGENSQNMFNNQQLLSSSTDVRSASAISTDSNQPDLSNYTTIMLVTDVRTSSSNDKQHIINQRSETFEDQIISESNTDEITPSATFLLQTSFTTFTYYTTMYNNDVTSVISRLDKITNVVTETLKATDIEKIGEAALPITYFTTFTYWTKLAKNGEITTLKREETVSNVVTPTHISVIHIAMANTEPVNTNVQSIRDTNGVRDNQKTINASVVSLAPVIEPGSEFAGEKHNVELATDVINIPKELEPTTYYTTYTFYTTSYNVDRTMTDSRFEIITNVITPTINLSLIAPSKTNEVNFVEVSTKLVNGIDQSTDSASFNVNNSKTSIFEKSAQALLFDYKKIIDADSVSTLYFITEILPTTAADGLAIEFTSTTTSLYVDEVKKALQPSSRNKLIVNAEGSTVRQYKTGLVRLIEGTRIGSHTTTLYQSKVIGTFIENRYAQIIESTSSLIFETNSNGAVTDTAIKPSPSIISALKVDAIQVTKLNIAGPSLQNSIPDNITELNLENDSGKEDDDNGVIGYDDDVSDDDYGDSDKASLPFQSKKRIFTPVIRPFTSRNRPRFSPKKKNSGPSSATIITRLDATPTITATPALKPSGRFNTRKGGFASGTIASGNATGISTLRRSFGRPIKPTASPGDDPTSTSNSPVTASNNVSFGSNRSRLSSSARSALQSSSRRGVVLVRPSYVAGFRPGLSSAYVGNSRIRIKPTSIGLVNQQNSPMTEDVTTLTPEISGKESTLPELQANESKNNEGLSDAARRNQNLLLRFRRPINRPAGFTPASQRVSNTSSQGSSISQKRNPLTTRAKTAMTTTSTTTATTQPTRARSFQRPQITSFQDRPRVQSNLFTPRGILQKQTILETTSEGKENKKQDDGSEDSADTDDDSEYDDEDEEDNEDDDSNRRRRSNRKQGILAPTIKETEKKMNAAKTKKYKKLARLRREAHTSQPSRRNFRNRFRRPKLSSVATAETAEERNFTVKVEHEMSTVMTRARAGGRFTPRYVPHHVSTQAVPASVSTASKTSHRAIRPTRPTSAREQFTLREKDATITTQNVLQRHGASNFRRPQTAASSRRSSPPTSNNHRKSYKNNNLSQDTSARSSSVRARNNLSRTRTTVRGRSRNDYNADPVVPSNDGTITITHVIPAEITIPVVNGKVTEYKNVVTAKTSTEVLGPQQYTSFVGGNRQIMLALTREDSNINFGGVTEITHYFLHETPTTTIIFTPTTIRGRKTSFSHVKSSTAYSVQTVVSTTQPQIPATAPLANILLSQLLLGNIGLPAANPLLGAIGAAVTPASNNLGVNTIISQILATPVTEYRTHSSTYVTTVFEGMSTVLPVTFQGKKILTTVYDTTAQTITATEFVTDTIVITPSQRAITQAQMASQVNSLILQQLLLQQQIQSHIEKSQQQLPIPILNSSVLQLPDNLQDLDTNNIRLSNENDNDIQVIEGIQSNNRSGRKKSRKSGKAHKRKYQAVQDEAPEGSSIITLYVSGRRPGEFSTILSTVPLGYDSTIHKRQVSGLVKQTAKLHTTHDFYLTDGSGYVPAYLMPKLYVDEMQIQPIAFNILESDERNLIEQQTQSLESIVGDVSKWIARSTQSNSVEIVDKLTELSNMLKSVAEEQSMSELFRVMSNMTESTANFHFLV